MANETGGPQIVVGVTLDANTAPGADQAISDVNRVKSAEASATASTEAAVAVDARAAQIMQEYGVSAQQAARALELLGPAASTAAIGSAELDAAIEATQRETVALGSETDVLAQRQQKAAAIASAYGVDLNIARMAMGRLGEAAATTAINSEAMEVALSGVQRGQAALQAEQAKTIAEMEALAAAEEGVATAGSSLVGVSDAVTAAMGRMGIAQADVSTAALKLGVSEEVAARAMVQMKQALLATDVAAARAELEGLTAAIDTEATSADVATVSTRAHTEELARNAIMARRASDGLVDLALGGRRAIQGVADLQFVLTGLLPEAAGVIATLGGIAIIGELWERASKRMEKAGDDAKELAAQQEKLGQGLARLQEESSKTGLDFLNQQLERMLSNTKAILDQQKEWDDASLKRIKSAENEAEASGRLALAKLEASKQVELAGAHTREDRDAIESKYASLAAGVSGATEAQKYDLETKALAAEKAQNDAERAALLEANRNNDAQLQSLTDRANSTAQKAAGTDDGTPGYVPNALGEFTKDQIDSQEAMVKAALAKYTSEQEETPREAIARQHVDDGIGTDLEKQLLADRAEEKKNAQEDYIAQEAKFADLRDAQQAASALKDGQKELKTSIDANSAAINKLVEALPDIASRRNVIDQDHQASVQTENARATEADAKSADEAQAKLKKIRDDDFEARKLKIDAEAALAPNDPTVVQQKKLLADDKARAAADDESGKQLPLPPTASTASQTPLQRNIDSVTARLDQLQKERARITDPELAKDQDALIKPLLDRLNSLLKNLDVANQYNPDSENTPAPAPTLDDLLKQAAARKLAAQLNFNDTAPASKRGDNSSGATTKDERDAGSQAEQFIQSINPSRQLAQQAHEAVQALDKGNAQGAAQLESILSRLVDTTKNLGQGQADAFKNIYGRLSAVQVELQNQADLIREARNNHI